MGKLYSVKELSEKTGISKAALYRLANNEEIKFYRIGNSIRFDLDDFIVDKKEEPDE